MNPCFSIFFNNTYLFENNNKYAIYAFEPTGIGGVSKAVT